MSVSYVSFSGEMSQFQFQFYMLILMYIQVTLVLNVASLLLFKVNIVKNLSNTPGGHSTINAVHMRDRIISRHPLNKFLSVRKITP